jgi:putative membrane protein
MEYKRDHPLSLISHIKRNISIIISMMIAFIPALQSAIGHGFLVYVLSLILSVLVAGLFTSVKWYKKKYRVNENNIEIMEGVFVKKNRIVPFSKIQTINLCDNIIYRIFKLGYLKMDTGENKIAKTTEVFIVLNVVEARSISEKVRNYQNNISEAAENRESVIGNSAGDKDVKSQNKAFIRTSFKELIIMSLTSNFIFKGMIFALTIFNFLDDLVKPILGGSLDKYIGKMFSKYNFSTKSIGYVILIIGVSSVFYILISMVLSVIAIFIRYYNFELRTNGKELTISYGLLEKKEFILPIKKINAVYINQTLLRRIFGLYSVSIESIGYGNEKGETNVIYQIARLKKARELINDVLPRYYYEGKFERAPKRALRRYINFYCVLPFLVIAVVLLITRNYYWIILFLPLFAVLAYYDYKNAGILQYEKLLVTSTGIFNRSISIINVNSIQAVATSTNPFKRRGKLVNLHISVRGNVMAKVITIKNLDDSANKYMQITKPDFQNY